MTHSTVRRRSGVARIAGLVAATALAGSGVVAMSTTAFAEDTAAADVPSLQTFDASDFADEAAELPDGLKTAIERDLDVSPAQYLASAEAGKVASHVLDALAEAGIDINGSVFDAGSQEITVYVEAEADVPVVEGVGAKVVVGEAPDDSGAPDEAEAFAAWKGGFGYKGTFADGFDYRCSAGFNGFGASGDPVVLTAGHCNADNEDVTWSEFAVDAPLSSTNTAPWPTGPEIGQGGTFQFSGKHDAGMFPVTNTADWDFPAVVSEWGGGVGSPDDGEVVVRDHIDPMVGQQVCRSGASSGFQCGEVLFVDQEVKVDDVPVMGFITTACATQGDSGGSYLVGNAAVGTLTGGSFPVVDNKDVDPDPDDACATWKPFDPEKDTQENRGGFTLPYAISGSDYSSTAFYGDDFELKVQIATPKVTAPKDGGQVGQTPTFKGKVDSGSPNYTAYLTIDGGSEYSAKVDTNGSFSIPVDDELAVGEHSYELVIGYGDHSRSEAVSGSFEVVEKQVEDLVVSSPEDGQTTGNARPSFTGSGQPGAEVELTVGDDAYGSATVGDDGSWTIKPESDLPKAQRFDAVVTQSFEGDEQSVTVADLGIRVSAATITVPEDGSEVAADVVFEGTAEPGSDLAITLVAGGADDDSDGMALTAFAEGDDEDAGEIWEGEWTFEGNAWTFTPAEPLENGEYTVEVDAQLGDDTDLGASSASSTFTVVKGGGGDAGGGDDDGGLPDTGSSTLPLIIGAIVLVLAGGGALVVVRARRNSSSVA